MTTYLESRKKGTKMLLLLHCVLIYLKKHSESTDVTVHSFSLCIKTHAVVHWQTNRLTTALYVLRSVKFMVMLKNERNIVA